MSSAAVAALSCRDCGSELAPALLSCPRCDALVHRDVLETLARDAELARARGDAVAERVAWQRVLGLLPPESGQAAALQQTVAALDARIALASRESDAKAKADAEAARAADTRPAWRRMLTSAGALIILALGKLKFLILGLSKLSTFFSMLAFVGVYWTAYGWPLAVGFAVSIYIHEMGHVAANRRHGIDASAPLFIPGFGALIRLRQHVTDRDVNAAIGLGGPLWGLGAAVAAALAWVATGNPIWAAIAHLGAWLNLFNLLPVWQLDGARGLAPLTRTQRATVACAMLVMFLVVHDRLLVVLGAVTLFRAWRNDPEARGNYRVLALFCGLVVTLSLLTLVRG